MIGLKILKCGNLWALYFKDLLFYNVPVSKKHFKFIYDVCLHCLYCFMQIKYEYNTLNIEIKRVNFRLMT